MTFSVYVCVFMCVLVLCRATAGRLEARHFRHTTFSRLCMLLLSSYNFLGVTVNADSNAPQGESGKKSGKLTACLRNRHFTLS